MTERGERGDGQLDTWHLSDDELAALREQRRAAHARGPATLVRVHRDGVRVLPVIEGEPRVIGRSAPSDVTLRDASLSRQHALVELLGGDVWIEDLGSTNAPRWPASASTGGRPYSPITLRYHSRFGHDMARTVAAAGPRIAATPGRRRSPVAGQSRRSRAETRRPAWAAAISARSP